MRRHRQDATEGPNMDLLRDLFTSSIGLLSLGVILFMLGMAAWFIWFFVSRSAHSGR